MIGLSLSLCIRDILKGDVKEDDVEKIVANTCAYNELRWDYLLMQYGALYWDKVAPRADAAALVGRLRAAGKIIQPRVDNRDYAHTTNGGVWVQSESEINVSKEWAFS